VEVEVGGEKGGGKTPLLGDRSKHGDRSKTDFGLFKNVTYSNKFRLVIGYVWLGQEHERK